jgi:hypothetical protein
MTTLSLPDLLVTHDPLGRAFTEVDGLEHPVLLARYAQGLEAVGAKAKAALCRAALIADGRCQYCGRGLSSERTVHVGTGRSCRK